MPSQDSPKTPQPSPLGGGNDQSNLENLPWTGITVVVAVLGLLLFMAVPMHTPNAREVLMAQRQRLAFVAQDTIGKAIEEYRADHAEWPGLPPSVASGLGPQVFEESWLRRQLEMPCNSAGDTLPTSTLEFGFGPYLPNGIPANPMNGLDSIRILGEGERFDAVVDSLYGWVYDPRSGELRPHILPFQQLPASRGARRRAVRINRK